MKIVCFQIQFKMIPYCLICFKDIQIEEIGSECPAQEIRKFLNIFHMQYLSAIPQKFICQSVNSCSLCSGLLKSYSDLYSQLECVQIKMQRQLEVLKSIMYQASRVPHRVNQFREDIFSDLSDEEKTEKLKEILNLRESVYKRCRRLVKYKNPYVPLLLKPFIKFENGNQTTEPVVASELKPIPNVDDTDVTSCQDHSPDITVCQNDNNLENENANLLAVKTEKTENCDSPVESGSTRADSDSEYEPSMESESSHDDQSESQSNKSNDSSLDSASSYDDEPLSQKPIPCSIDNCTEMFSSKLKKELHVKLHGEFTCNFCSYSCNFATNLLHHEWNNHTEDNNGRTVKCSRCTKEFLSLTNHNARAHFFKTHLNIDYCNAECLDCGQKFVVSKGSVQAYLSKHRQLSQCNRDKKERPKRKAERTKCEYICPEDNCGKSFRLPDQLSIHRKMHGNFTCKFCSFQTNLAYQLMTHEWNNHTINNKAGKIQCSRCPKTFKGTKLSGNDAPRKKHFFRDHLGIAYEHGECAICGMKFAAGTCSFEQSLRIHMQTQHGSKKSRTAAEFRCDVCQAPFKIARQLVIHKFRVHKRFNFDCPVCQKSFYRLKIMESHLKSKHKDFDFDKAKKFACDFAHCTSRFLHRVSLDHHKDRHKTPMFKCPKCEKWLIDQSCLDSHMNRHKPKMPAHLAKKRCSAVCELCGKRFYGKSNNQAENALSTHKMSKLHGENWEYSCELCGKTCQNVYKLEEHVRTHTGEKPFLCNVCGREFSIKYNLKRHVKLVHDGKSRETAAQ